MKNKQLLICNRILMYSLYGLAFQFLLCSMLLAADISLAQETKSVKEARTSISFFSENLSSVFDKIEKQTHFLFTYNGNVINRKIRITDNYDDVPLFDILMDISKKTNLKFKQINNNILVSLPETDDLVQAIEIVETVTITGKITDENGQGLPGATIIEKGTSNGTTSDLNGNYKLSVSEEAVLVVSFVGYTSQEIILGSRSTIDVQMQLDAAQLNEVVIVGYGTKNKANLTSGIATVNTENIETRPITNLAQALAGTTTGVTTFMETDQPGKEEISVQIRGFNTINNASPLVLVDGVVGSLIDVNPTDIAEFTILKDGAAAAIYGSRAANGVILVTTKRGTAGKLNVGYRGYYGTQKAASLPDVVSSSVDYMKIANTFKTNAGQTQFYDDATIAEWENANDVLHANTDWLDLLLGGTGTMHSHQISLNGGTELAKFNISLNYLNQEGVALKTENKYLGFRANFDSKVSEKLSVGLNLAGGKRDVMSPGSVNNILTLGSSTNPMVVPYYDGRYGGANTNEDGDLHNGLMQAHVNGDNIERYNFLGKIFATYNFNDHLSYQVNAAFDYDNALRSQYTTTWKQWNFLANEIVNNSGPMDLTDRMTVEKTSTFYNILRYSKTFLNVHNLNAMGGYSQEKYRDDFLQGFKKDFLTNDLFELNAAVDEASMIARGSGSENSLQSFFGTINYDYNSKYFLDIIARYDGSSKFSKNNRWGFFPAVSVGWFISEESFFESVSAFDFLKIRASWSEVGNNRVDDYAYIATYGAGTNYSFGGQFTPGIAIVDVVNPDLKWETTVGYDFGIDASFLDGKLKFTADYFDKETRDMIEPVSIPALSGLGDSRPQKNVGTMSNNGFEFSLDYKDDVGSDFKYSALLTLSTVNNKLKEYNESVDGISGGFILREGESVYSLYGYEFTGIFQTQDEVDAHAFQNNVTGPGDLIFKDQNGDDIIDGDDRVILGSSLPDFTYGLVLNFGYKGFDLSTIFSGSHGAKGYLTGNFMTPLLYPDRGTFITDWLDHWTPTNTDTNIPRPSEHRLYNTTSSWQVHSLSYLKLGNLQLGYTFPQKVLDKLRMTQMRLFVNGQNLLTFTGFPHTDPQRGQRETGIKYPPHRIFSFGIDLKF